MSTLARVSIGNRIIDEAIVALVKSLRPTWLVEPALEEPEPGKPHIVRLELVGTGRWMAILCERDDGSRAASALSEGARAVLPLDAQLEHLVLALDALAVGDSPYLPVEVARSLAAGVLSQRGAPGPTISLQPRLTPRESEVLGLVARGLSNREIAARLSLSVNTVRTHLQSLSVKLHASTRAKMVANAWESGLPLPPRPQGRRAGGEPVKPAFR